MSDQPTNAPTARCPWCKVADVAVESMQCCDRVVTGVDEDNGPVYWAECQRCGAQGPIVGWAADAIPKWNESAPAPVAPGAAMSIQPTGIAFANSTTDSAPVVSGGVSETLSNIRRLAKEAIDAAARNDPKEDTTCSLYFRPDGVPIGHDRLVATVHNVAWVKYFSAVNPRDLLAALSPDAKVGGGE